MDGFLNKGSRNRGAARKQVVKEVTCEMGGEEERE